MTGCFFSMASAIREVQPEWTRKPRAAGFMEPPERKIKVDVEEVREVEDVPATRRPSSVRVRQNLICGRDTESGRKKEGDTNGSGRKTHKAENALGGTKITRGIGEMRIFRLTPARWPLVSVGSLSGSVGGFTCFGGVPYNRQRHPRSTNLVMRM